MKLIPYDIDKIERKAKPTMVLGVLEEFVASGEKCVEIVDYPHKTVKSCYETYCKAIKRYHVNNVEICTRKGRVFLIRKV